MATKKGLPWRILLELEKLKHNGKGNTTYAELQHITGIHPSNLNRAINKLEEKGYVELGLICKKDAFQKRLNALSGRKHVTRIVLKKSYLSEIEVEQLQDR